MTYYKPGTWNVVCSVCGVRFKSDQILKRWDGQYVCHNDFETRHSLDFIRSIPDYNIVPFTNQEPADEFVYVCTLQASQGLADYSEADCGRADIQYHVEF